MRLGKANYSSLTYPYNSAYMKLFSTFDKNTITLCQFYSGELPLSYAVDVQTLNFYTTLRELNCNPSNILFKWFGNEELIALESKYGIEGKHVFRDYNKLIRKSFDDHCATLNVSWIQFNKTLLIYMYLCRIYVSLLSLIFLYFAASCTLFFLFLLLFMFAWMLFTALVANKRFI